MKPSEVFKMVSFSFDKIYFLLQECLFFFPPLYFFLKHIHPPLPEQYFSVMTEWRGNSEGIINS